MGMLRRGIPHPPPHSSPPNLEYTWCRTSELLLGLGLFASVGDETSQVEAEMPLWDARQLL